MKIEAEHDWLTTAEAAFHLGVNASRIRQLLLKDQGCREDRRTFPSARRANPQEERELQADRRVGRIPREGVWLIGVKDIERRKLMLGPLQIGRPHQWKDHYADCPWFSGTSAPAREALVWACDGDNSCSTVMLSESIQRFYERCMPAPVLIEGSWETMMPKKYTQELHSAYQQHAYGKIATLMAPFHTASGLANVIIQLERSFTRHTKRKAPMPKVEK
ncbi:hypothetical protein KDA_75400 [Dictyobacter alpinus]|uniref:Uncharacterized protein n=1 Tax=Dictyobacter alpinus TaxID=2014873 RepID=A0A402BL55_9CHLR|nr:hypothetical protein [Dictyobacter alpinus]GCE32056.1 hypothetical protein KDA_75400 [Dictyobacter alpinus]